MLVLCIIIYFFCVHKYKPPAVVNVDYLCVQHCRFSRIYSRLDTSAAVKFFRKQFHLPHALLILILIDKRKAPNFRRPLTPLTSTQIIVTYRAKTVQLQIQIITTMTGKKIKNNITAITVAKWLMYSSALVCLFVC